MAAVHCRPVWRDRRESIECVMANSFSFGGRWSRALSLETVTSDAVPLRLQSHGVRFVGAAEAVHAAPLVVTVSWLLAMSRGRR